MQHIEKLSEAWRLFTLPAYLPICLLCLSVYLSVCLLCLSHLTNITRMSRIAVGATATAVANHVIPTSARHSRTCARRRSNEPPQQHSTASACHIIDLFSIISPSTPLFSYTSYNTTFSLWIDVTEDATTQARRRHTRPPTTWTECAHHSSAEIGLTPLCNNNPKMLLYSANLISTYTRSSVVVCLVFFKEKNKTKNE